MKLRSTLTILGAMLVGAFASMGVQIYLHQNIFKPSGLPDLANLDAPSKRRPSGFHSDGEMNSPCKNLYNAVCSVNGVRDPTGSVRRNSEGEADVLRYYASIIRSHPKLSMSEIDQLLVERVYTKKRKATLEQLFHLAQSVMEKDLLGKLFPQLTSDERTYLKKKLENVHLEMPPPASIYADDPELVLRNDIFYERDDPHKSVIRVGGALILNLKSHYNLAFTMAHELSHAIDPCELRETFHLPEAYMSVLQCMAPGYNLDHECSTKGDLPEKFSDWIATHVVGHKIALETSFTSQQKRNAVYNSVRDLCSNDDEVDPDFMVATVPVIYASRHPSGIYRMNEIFGRHPEIRSVLGCEPLAEKISRSNQCERILYP